MKPIAGSALEPFLHLICYLYRCAAQRQFSVRPGEPLIKLTYRQAFSTCQCPDAVRNTRKPPCRGRSGKASLRPVRRSILVSVAMYSRPTRGWISDARYSSLSLTSASVWPHTTVHPGKIFN